MPLVGNKSEAPHRYYDYARKRYLVWAPGEIKDVPDAIARHVCQAHPDKLELVVPVPAEAADDITTKVTDRAQRGGRRRSTRTASTTRGPRATKS